MLSFCQTTKCNVVRIKCPLESTSINWQFRHIVAITREKAPVWLDFQITKPCNHTYLQQCDNCREYCYWSSHEIEIQNYYALKDDGLYKCTDGKEEATGHLNFINRKLLVFNFILERLSSEMRLDVHRSNNNFSPFKLCSYSCYHFPVYLYKGRLKFLQQSLCFL